VLALLVPVPDTTSPVKASPSLVLFALLVGSVPAPPLAAVEVVGSADVASGVVAVSAAGVGMELLSLPLIADGSTAPELSAALSPAAALPSAPPTFEV
jgi:hypothetical protein